MPEAPPNQPGHVGYTPQPSATMGIVARLRAVFSDPLVFANDRRRIDGQLHPPAFIATVADYEGLAARMTRSFQRIDPKRMTPKPLDQLTSESAATLDPREGKNPS